MSSISYANVAATGASVESETKPKVESTPIENGEVDVKEDSPVSESPVATEGDKKEKKILAPAPVPEKSAWGATSATDSAASGVDEHKWPTPDKIQLDQASTKNYQQKFIKPITNKWVPISAKVILPNTRNNSQKQNRTRKNKSAGNSSKTAPHPQKKQPNNPQTSVSPQPQQPIIKKEEFADSTESESAESIESETIPVAADPALSFEADAMLAQQNMDNINQQYPPQFNNQYQKFNPNGPQAKNFRRFNNQIGGQQQFNKRFPNQPQQPQHPQQVPQNGFYHPQPFVQNQNFNNFNNRQFRPQNGQFRPNNRTYRQNNGYRNGSIGMPPHMGGQFNGIPPQYPPQVQIPPPISPKQDPQQALVQQIDYYFSLENLIRDIYLRKNMDIQGWVSLALILNFKRVKIIINGIQNSFEADEEPNTEAIVLDAIKQCDNLEINYINDKTAEDAAIEDINLRVKDNFEQWLLPVEN
jgi:la-related protein 1